MGAELLLLPVFLPLVAALVAAATGSGGGRWLALGSCLLLLAGLGKLTMLLPAAAGLDYLLAGVGLPLGIRLHLDGLSLLLLWLVTVVYTLTTLHACFSIGTGPAAARFWPPWLLLLAALNGLLLSADLFNLYVALEVAGLCGIALIVWERKAEALTAAMRYLLLAMLASLFYLLGVAIVYAATGALDLTLAGQRLDGGVAAITALGLMTAGLLLKSAIFPLHGWLPPAHGSAPAPVSAILSALLVKVSLYLLYRIWFWMPVPALPAGQLLGTLGAGALLYGSVMALRQQRLKYLVAYSTVAQLGYLMVVFALPGAWNGSIYHLLSHGLAKAAMFLAAGNMLWCLGSDRLDRLPGVERHVPASVLAFALAAVSLMGLPPSGGFIAKWMLLTAAWAAGAWAWVALLLAGSLLAAAYLFRVLALTFSPANGTNHPAPLRLPHQGMEIAALLLALLAIAAGFAASPLLTLVDIPPGLTPEPGR